MILCQVLLGVCLMLNKNSVTIKLPRKISDTLQIDQWEDIWRKADSLSYSIPQDLSVDEIRNYFSFFMNRLPSEFAFTVLGEIAEFANAPWDLLEKLFNRGDTGCMVSICCRPDLSGGMLTKCLNSSNPDVIEHVVFHNKISIQDCESLLQRPLEKHTLETIQRAIAQKKGAVGSALPNGAS